MTADVLTRAEVAALFHVHPQTVSKWCQRGDMPFFWLPGRRVRKFYRADVEAFMERQTTQLSA
jgi:excisionase family DNA binding protein